MYLIEYGETKVITPLKFMPSQTVRTIEYQVVFKPKAIKSLKKIPAQDRINILTGIEKLPDNLRGDVKRLTNFTPEYRLRVGKYRILFEIEEETILVYNILLRKTAYRRKSC